MRIKPRYIPITAAILFAAFWYYPLVSSLIKPTVIPNISALREDKTPQNNHLLYPRLGITSPVIVSKETSPLNYSDWNQIRAALRQGVNLAFDTQKFQDAPFAFLTGHSSDTYPHTYSSIFAGLGQAKTDDEILLNIDNTLYTFSVTETKILKPSDIKSFEELKNNLSDKKRLVLVTCWPVLTTNNRMVVIAEEVK